MIDRNDHTTRLGKGLNVAVWASHSGFPIGFLGRIDEGGKVSHATPYAIHVPRLIEKPAITPTLSP